MQDVENKKPPEPDTIFRIYSMSKPITSIAVMILYEDGHFQLGTPVSRFIRYPHHDNWFGLGYCIGDVSCSCHKKPLELTNDN